MKRYSRMKDVELINLLGAINLEVGEYYEQYLDGAAAWGMIAACLGDMHEISKEMYKREKKV